MAYDFVNCPERTGTDSTKWTRYEGRDIIPAWVADMDFKIAPEIIDALRTRLDHGLIGYPVQPPASVLAAAVEYLEVRRGWKVDPSWIVFTPALVAALNATIRACAGSGSVVTHVPVYPPFISAPANSGHALTKIPMDWDEAKRRWHMCPDRLEAETPADAKVFMLCNPFNPLGRVFDRPELEALAAYAAKHDLTVCSDEIHCDLVLDQTKSHISFATLSPDAADRSVSLFAASKTWNLAGLFCGFAVIPNASRRAAFRRVIQGVMNEVNVFGYVGTEAAFRHGEAWRLELLDVLRTNLDLIEAMCRETPGVKLRQRPEATYLAWLDVSELGFTNPRTAFEEGGVGMNDGADFAGPGHVRLNFACPTDRLREILKRMRAVALAAKK